MRRKSLYVAIAVITLASLSSSAQAQEHLCDTAFEDCRAPLWSLIDNETVGIDIAYWFMQDTSISNKVVARWQAGVPVRILVDPRANPTYAGNEQILNQFKAAGIPMRFKHGGGILHWKMMMFAGQNTVTFSGANFSPSFFVPTTPHSNYIDEAIYFTSDQSLMQSFKTKYDNLWTDTVNYSDYANIIGPLTRNYPTFAIDSELNFPPSLDDSQDFYNRTAANMNAETQKIDIVMYRITNQRYTDTTIAAVQRGVPVRLIHEPDEYRNPARQWDSWNVDRMFMAGVQIKMRKHLGLNHQKSVLLYGKGMTIFGSSNWTGPSSNSQEEHNYFTTKKWFFDWFVDQFERKWNSSTENVPFVPLVPEDPVNQLPANGATGQSTTITLRWEGGRWAHKYDIYLGTTSNPPLLVADASTDQSGAGPGQPRLNSGSVDDGHVETFTIPMTLQPGTTYFWRIVGKTMANKTANGPLWSFTTSGSAPAPTPTPSPTPTPTPGTESPNNTRVPPATEIVDSTGAVWTRTSNGAILRNGVSAAGGVGSQILYCNRIIYVFGTDSQWYRWNGGWTGIGPVDPCGGNTPTPSPTPTPTPTPTPSQESPNNTRVPPATQIVDSNGDVWTRTNNGTILRNGQGTSGAGSEILYCNRIVYAFGTDSQWYRWNNGWTPIGTVDPCGGTTSPSPTPTPTAPTVGTVSPASGPTVGGTSITITGTGFASGATVSVGGTAASSVAVANSTTITALTPAHAAGTVDVTVTNSSGLSGTKTGAFTYTVQQTAVPLFDRVFIVVDENQSYENVIGSASMPYLNALANRYGLAINYFANTQPSIGDYFWLTTGQNITNDSNFSGTVTADNIVRQLTAAGKSWKAYAESIPSTGYLGGDAYPYVKRHNPFAYFSDVINSPDQANNIVPFTQFGSDLAGNQFPNYSFIIPNQQNNAHDCPAAIPNCTNADKLAAADKWLKTHIDPLISSTAFRQGGLLILTWDESVNTDKQNGGGHVVTVVISSKTHQGYESPTFFQHQSTLRLSAEALGLTSYPGAAATANNMSEFFSGTPNTAPIVAGVSPASGSTTGGTSVIISGTGFAQGATVTFGGANATSVTVVGSTTITAVTPARPSGGVNVVVTNPGGQSGSKNNAFTYGSAPPAPSVSGIAPNSGSTAGGTSVTISGSGFVSGATVSIGLTPASNVNVVNGSTITATTPPHAAGTVNVVVQNPDGQSGTLVNGYTYASGGETVLLEDDFNNGVIDGGNWIANNLFSGFTDTSVALQETTQFRIGPLKQGAGGSHYNGIRSASAFNFTGGYAYVQLVQAPNSSTSADAFFTIGLNVDNAYRMYVEAGNLIVQSRLGGGKQSLVQVAFNSVNHAFWRIRHDAMTGQVVFETAPANGSAPGTWVQLISAAWNTSAVPLTSMNFELKAGTWKSEGISPGTVVFDNFKAARP